MTGVLEAQVTGLSLGRISTRVFPAGLHQYLLAVVVGDLDGAAQLALGGAVRQVCTCRLGGDSLIRRVVRVGRRGYRVWRGGRVLPRRPGRGVCWPGVFQDRALGLPAASRGVWRILLRCCSCEAACQLERLGPRARCAGLGMACASAARGACGEVQRRSGWVNGREPPPEPAKSVGLVRQRTQTVALASPKWIPQAKNGMRLPHALESRSVGVLSRLALANVSPGGRQVAVLWLRPPRQCSAAGRYPMRLQQGITPGSGALGQIYLAAG